MAARCFVFSRGNSTVKLVFEYKAEQQRTTVSGALARELDAIAGAEAPELSAAIAGFAAAIAWPDAEHAQLPC